MYLFVQDTDGNGELLTLASAADVQVRPGFVYTFLDLDPAQIQFTVAGQDIPDLIMDVEGKDAQALNLQPARR